MKARRGILILAALLSAAAGCRARPRTPVILISIDTLRPDHLGCYGYSRPTSANLDAFAKDAVLFRQAISHAPSTLPAHASLLTSLIPPHHGACISDNLARAPRGPDPGRGAARRGLRHGVLQRRGAARPGLGPRPGLRDLQSVKPRGAPAESLVDEHDRFSFVTEQARAWILSHEAPEPFFLFLHTYEVHHPYSPDPADLDVFRGDYKGPLPDRITVDLLQQIDRGTVRVDDRDRQHVIDAYDAEIRSMDRAFGVFVAFLKEKGLYDPALIVVTSDHGEEFGEHGRLGWHSHSLFDELLRVPLLVKLPASRLAGSAVTDQVRGIDVAPTVLSVLGLGLPSAFEGHSALDEGARRGDANETWSSRDVTTPNSVVSLRTPEWKLFDGRLYSLADDPGEQHDVAKAHEDVARRLAARRKALAAERPRPAPRSAAPDDALRERLRSLGYVE